MDIFCLRIRREKAGKVFPFDRVYLARNNEHGIFKQMFRYALVMPVEGGLEALLLEHCLPEKGETHPFDRDDSASPPTAGDFSEALENGEWVMAVPILSKFIASNIPRYITAAGQYRAPSPENAVVKTIAGKRRRRSGYAPKDLKEPFPTLTYLQTPQQDIRPVCIACPRFMLHQNGRCRLGEEICYTNLAMGLHNHFEEGLSEKAPAANVIEEFRNIGEEL